MLKLQRALEVYRNDGIAHVCDRTCHWLVGCLGTILPAQTESRRIRDAARYWSESRESSRIRGFSHWVGEGQLEDSDVWAGIGESHFEMWKRFTASCGDEQVGKRMVEWGPGGGANAIMFARVFENFYGVDISEASLNECGKQLAMRGFKGFTPVLIDAASPEEAMTQINEPCDFFLSTAVFQHFPSKAYGARVLSVASDMLRPGAIALIQIRYDDLSRRFRPKSRDYNIHVIAFTSYKLHEFWRLASEKGFTPHFIELRPNVNYAYFYLRKKKA